MSKSVPRWSHRSGANRSMRLVVRNLNKELLWKRINAKNTLRRVYSFTDMPDEILVIIFNFVLVAAENMYNSTLPRVCSRWTNVMYRYVYINGFIMEDYDSRIARQLRPFIDIMDESDYSPIINKPNCISIMDRYRITLHPRTFTFIIMRAGMKTDAVTDSIRTVVRLL